jgi:hypothetical protein
VYSPSAVFNTVSEQFGGVWVASTVGVVSGLSSEQSFKLALAKGLEVLVDGVSLASGEITWLVSNAPIGGVSFEAVGGA